MYDSRQVLIGQRCVCCLSRERTYMSKLYMGMEVVVQSESWVRELKKRCECGSLVELS